VLIPNIIKYIRVKDYIISLQHLFYLLALIIPTLFFMNQLFLFRWLPIVLAPYVLPYLFVHGEYFLKNRNTALEVEENIIILYQGEEKYRLGEDEITSIELHLAGGVYKNTDWENLPFQNYHYMKIVDGDGKAFYITSILVNHIPRQLCDFIAKHKAKVAIKKRFLASSTWDNLPK